LISFAPSAAFFGTTPTLNGPPRHKEGEATPYSLATTTAPIQGRRSRDVDSYYFPHSHVRTYFVVLHGDVNNNTASGAHNSSSLLFFLASSLVVALVAAAAVFPAVVLLLHGCCYCYCVAMLLVVLVVILLLLLFVLVFY
jgi:hypothetical protein